MVTLEGVPNRTSNISLRLALSGLYIHVAGCDLKARAHRLMHNGIISKFAYCCVFWPKRALSVII